MSDETSAPANVSPGDKIAGYRLEERIGQGGMAVVYRAHDERLDRRVALKLLAPGLAADTAFRTRFIRESRAAAAVDHPNIIPVYDAGDAGGFLFIAMRYVQGGDVRSLFSGGQVLSPARVWNIISQVAAALDAAHAHDLVHRDVKPANILLDTGGRSTGGNRATRPGEENDHVYLSDFGISKQTLASHLTSTGQFVGTLDYIAPEQIEAQTIDGRVDQYSLACATYEMLTGEPPFRRDLGLALINAHLSAPTPSAVAKRADLPAAVDQVLAKAMSKSPDDRYATCTDFATDLGKAVGAVAGTPLVAGAGPALPPAQPAVVHPATQLADGPVTPPVNQAPPANQAVPQAGVVGAVAAGAAGAIGAAPLTPQWPAGMPGGFDVATQYAGQTPPPQQSPQQPPQGQTPPPQQQPQGWPGSGQVGYPQQGQQQPYLTGPIAPYPGQVGPTAQGGWQQQPYQTGPYPGQVGPTAQGGWQPPQPPKQRSRGVLIGAVTATIVIVVAVVAIVAVVALKKNNNNNGSGGPSTSITSTTPSGNNSSSTTPDNNSTPPPAGPTEQSEATSVSTLLMNSANTRSQWDSTVLVNNTGNCVDIDEDVTQIGDIANSRQTELNQADSLQFDKIPNGDTLKNELMSALEISLNIDNDYLNWAKQQQSSNCGYGTNSSYYEDASSKNDQATEDKQTFLDNWDPVASQFNLPQFSAGQI